jgi:prepilin-type N-terminal cleavage/methylation domain-containing protein
MSSSTSTRTGHPAQQRGFTVVEMVVVATIAVILTAFALIKYSPTTINLVTEADRVRHDLRLMQMLAMNWGTPLRFTPAASGWTFSCPQAVANTPCAGGTLSATAASAAGLEAVAFDAQLEPGISFSGGTLDYDSMGRPASSCNTTCSLLSAAYTATLSGGGSTQTITVDPITGFQR